MDLRVLIADDEPHARSRLARLIQSLPGVHVVAQASGGEEAVAMATQADACFLDVEMPGRGGFEVAQALGGKPLVFVTAHARYAVKAFDLAAVDFLVKPVSLERLSVSLERLRRAAPPAGLHLLVVSRREMRRVDATAVTRFRAQDKYVSFRDEHGEEHLLRDSLDALHARLGPAFVRVHKAELVRASAIVRLSGAELALSDAQVVPVSRRSLAEVRRLLQRSP